MTTNEETIEILNDLLTKAYDAEQGYAQAAERAADSPSLADFFKRQSSMRLSIGHDLKTEITRLGGEPDKGASLTAKAHQAWIALKGFATGDDEAAILKECIRGEEAALEDYGEALANNILPQEVTDLITGQQNEIRDALAGIKVKEVTHD